MSSFWKLLTPLMQTTLARHLGYYTGFCFLTWFFHLLLISLLTFIHLQIGHGLKVVDEWFFQNAWMIISFSQFLALSLVFHFASLWSDRRQLLGPVVRQGWIPARPRVYVVIAFLWLVSIFWGEPSFKLEADFFKNIVSGLGITLFFGMSVFLVGALNEIFPLNAREKKIQIFLVPVLFWMMVETSFPYKNTWSFELIFVLIFSLYLYFWKGENWTHPTLFLTCFVAPLGAFLGNDPLWGSTFSFWKMENPIKSYEWAVVLFLSWLYLLVRRKEHWDFKDIKMAYAKVRTLKEKLRGIR